MADTNIRWIVCGSEADVFCIDVLQLVFRLTFMNSSGAFDCFL
jgi:hypothetical protein